MKLPTGVYSPIVRCGDLTVLSGQLGIRDGRLVDGVAQQLTTLLENAEGLLKKFGLDRTNVFKTTIFLTDMNDFAAVNEIWTEYWPDPRPARTTIAVKELPLAAAIEVEFMAHDAGFSIPEA